MTLLESRLEEMQERIEKLEQRRSLFVRLHTFDPEPFDLLSPVEIVVEQDGEDYNASFFDANVHASGCNEFEAIANLKENLLSRFDYLDRVPAEKLAKPLRQQIAVLRQFVRRKSETCESSPRNSP